MVSPSRTLYVAGIDQSISADTLEEQFGRHAKVEKVTIIKDKITQESKGFAYVLMSSIDDAHKTLKEMDGKVIGDKPIKVKFSFSDNPGPPPDSRGSSYRGRGGGRYMERGGSRFSSSYRGSSSDGGGYSSNYRGRGRGSDRGGRGSFSDRGRGSSSYRGRDDMRSSRGGRGRGGSRYDAPSYREREEYPRREMNGSYDDYDRGRAPSVRSIDSYSRGPSRDSYGRGTGRDSFSRGAGRDSYGARGASTSDYGRLPPRYETERRSSFGQRDSFPTSDYRDRSPPARGYDERPMRSIASDRDRFDDRAPQRRPIRQEPRSDPYREERPVRRDYDSLSAPGRHDPYSSAPRSTRDYDHPPPRRPPPRESGGYAGYGSDLKDDYGGAPRYTRSYNSRDY